jgi:long-chain acyl-CoA synthetase
MKRTVLTMLETAAQKYASIAYVSEKKDAGWVNKTYSDVNKESKLMAYGLLDLGFGKGDKIAILAEGRMNWVIGEYGLLKAGCTAVPLSIKLMPEEILFRLNHSDSKAIIISRNLIEKLSPIWQKILCKKFKIIYIEDSKEDLKKLNLSFDVEKNVVLISELIDLGSKTMGKNEGKLHEITDQISEDDIVTISYTSGTTGNPKGIMLSHLNYFSNSNGAMEYFKIPEFYKSLIILPLDHSFAHTVGIFISLINGLSLYFVDARGGSINTLKNIPINLKEVKPDFLLTVPALTGNFMKKMQDGIDAKGGIVKKIFDAGLKAGIEINGDGYRKAPLSVRMKKMAAYQLANKLIFGKLREVFGGNLKFCVGGGALLDVKQQKFFYAIGTPVFQGYGLTEATPIISANTPAKHKLGTSGGVINGVKCKIIKSDGTQAKVNEKGEIVIWGDNVMKGYYKNPQASAEVLRDGGLYTGDMGYYEEDGFLMVTGREKALLISQDGEKYSPEEIEEAIVNSSEFIEQCMIYNDHKKYTTAIATLNVQKLASFIKKHHITAKKDLVKVVKDSFHQYKNEAEYKDKIPEKWTPSVFMLVTEPFTEENKMINSTLKMVRYKIIETYKNEIDEMYMPEKDKIADLKNEALLSKLFLK